MKIEFHKDPVSFLGANLWFAAVPAEFRCSLLEGGRRTGLAKGQLYGQTPPRPGLLAVLSGSLRVEIALGSSRHVLFDIAGPGTILALPEDFEGRPGLVRLRASEKTLVLGVDSARLKALASQDAAVGNALQALVQSHINHILVVTAGALTFAPRGKVASRLLSSADRRIDQKDFANLTQADLAEMTGLSRKSVHGHLRALEALAIIEVVYGGVRILDRAKLEATGEAR